VESDSSNPSAKHVAWLVWKRWPVLTTPPKIKQYCSTLVFGGVKENKNEYVVSTLKMCARDVDRVSGIVVRLIAKALLAPGIISSKDVGVVDAPRRTIGVAS
jgi:hypothetical protein